jgi:hypothetical protein
MILAMAGTDFPDDLRAAQTRLHQATAELTALCRKLPWNAEPAPGRPGTAHPHADDATAGRAESPGWTEEEKEAVARLRTECVELSLRPLVRVRSRGARTGTLRAEGRHAAGGDAAA